MDPHNSLSLSLLWEKEVSMIKFQNKAWPAQTRNPVIKSTACVWEGRSGGGTGSRSGVAVRMAKVL